MKLTTQPATGTGAGRFDAEAAWSEALERHYAELCDYALSLLRSADLAEDVVHDLFLYLWRTRHLGDASRFSRSYLFVAARNRVRKHMRHQRVAQGWVERALREEAVAAESPDEICQRHDLERSVECAIAELPPRSREVFLLRRRENLSYSEIALRVGVSVNTVKSHMWRAALVLREKLRAHLDK